MSGESLSKGRLGNARGVRHADLQDWLRFLRAEAHFLRDFPALLFQHAGNQPDNTAPARAAQRRWESGAETRPWLRWRNKPQHRPPCLATFLGHSRFPVSACAFSPDASRLVSAAGPKAEDWSEGGELMIWDTTGGEELLRITLAQRAAFSACRFSPDGERVAARSTDGMLRVWDARTGTEVRTMGSPEFPVLDWSWASGRLRIASTAADGTLVVSEPDDPRALVTLSSLERPAGFCVFSPDGTRIASASGRVSNDTIAICDAGTGVCLARLNPDQMDISAVQWSPDGYQIVAAGQHHTRLLHWDLRPSPPERKAIGAANQIVFGRPVCAFSPDSRWLVWGNQASFTQEGWRELEGPENLPLSLWDVTSGRCLGAVDAHEGGVRACAFADAGRLATTSGRAVKLWDLDAIQQSMTMPRHWAAVTDCAAFADGRRAVSVSWDQTAKLWDLRDGEELATLGSHPAQVWSCAAAPDGSEIACRFRKDPYHAGAVWLWNPVTLVPHTKLPAGEEWKGLAYSPDGTGLLVPGALVWRRTTAQYLSLAETVAAAWAPEGRRFVGGQDDGTVKVWDVHTGGELASLPALPGQRKGTTACVFSPDGSHIVSATGDGWLRIWDVRRWQEVRAFKAHNEEIRTCIFSPDGRTLLTVADWEGVALWDARSGTRLECPPAGVGRFSPDGERMALGSKGALLVWEPRTGNGVARFPFPDEVHGLVWTPRRIVAGDSSGTLAVLEPCRLPQAPPVTTATYAFDCLTGRWTAKPVGTCGWCGIRFEASADVLETIGACARASDQYAGEPSNFSLPDAAWEDPRLRTTCPACRQPVRYNPFVADDRERVYPPPVASHEQGWRSLYDPVRLHPEPGEPIPLDETSLDPVVLGLVPRTLCQEHTLIPLRTWRNGIHILVAEPIPERVVDQLEFLTGRKVKLSLASRATIAAALRRFHSTERLED